MAAGMVGRLSGKLIPKNSSLFLCDMQDKFRPSIKYFDAIVSNSGRLLRAASILDMPVVCTEQYPQGKVNCRTIIIL